MNTDTLRDHLRQICLEAIDSNWATIEPYMKEMAYDILRDKQSWEYATALRQTVDTAFSAAIKHHTNETFAAVVDQMAKEKVRAELAKRLKARGMETTLLDIVP